MAETFGDLLESYRERLGWSRMRLGREAGMDTGYVSRLEKPKGKYKRAPSHEMLDAIMRALNLSPAERDRLSLAAAFCPPSILTAGGWTDTWQAVADVLNDDSLTESDREQYRSVLLEISKWRGRHDCGEEGSHADLC